MEGFLTGAELAARIGIQTASIYRYRSRGDLPEPDEMIGRSPLWKVETIDAWLKDRPGHGWRKSRTHSGPSA